MQCRQSKRTCSACDVSVLDLFPQEAGQNAVDKFHHLGGLVLTGDLHRLTDGHTVGISGIYRISYMATRMTAEAISGMRSKRQPCAYRAM